MLVDPIFDSTNQLHAMIHEILDRNEVGLVRHQAGVYEIGHFNLNHMLDSDQILEEYPEFEIGDPAEIFGKTRYFEWNSYGVCDSIEQFFSTPIGYAIKYEPNRDFVVSFTKISRSEQPSSGGWRWHKWGPYIGKHEPTCEYLYEEDLIDEIYVYHVIELFRRLPNASST